MLISFNSLTFAFRYRSEPFTLFARVQVDILVRQLSALQTQLDTKKRDFYEYVAKELQELQDCGRLDEVENVLVLVRFVVNI